MSFPGLSSTQLLESLDCAPSPTLEEREAQGREAYRSFCELLDAERPPAIAKLREATSALLDEAEDAARATRKSTSGSQRAVRPGEPEGIPEGDLTKKFQALKQAVAGGVLPAKTPTK